MKKGILVFYAIDEIDCWFEPNPRNWNGETSVVVVVVAVAKRFVDEIGRFFITNVFDVVVAAIDRRALSEGGRFVGNGGW
jgi:hypothetical protein